MHRRMHILKSTLYVNASVSFICTDVVQCVKLARSLSRTRTSVWKAHKASYSSRRRKGSRTWSVQYHRLWVWVAFDLGHGFWKEKGLNFHQSPCTLSRAVYFNTNNNCIAHNSDIYHALICGWGPHSRSYCQSRPACFTRWALYFQDGWKKGFVYGAASSA